MHIEQALKSIASAHTKRSYRHCLEHLSAWLGVRELTYAALVDYRAALVSLEMSPQNINQHLSAIRFYAKELANLKIIDIEAANALCGIKSLKVKGRKLGNWMSIKEAENLLNQPDISTPLGLRDRAILALMIGGGLRRSEIISLQVKHMERRDGRWMLIGVAGKHGRTRNVPIADWVKAIGDQWLSAAGIATGYMFRAVYFNKKAGKLTLRDEPLDPTAVYHIVKRYGKHTERFTIAPHDLRRTFARLAYEGGAPLKQIQLTLGHENEQTTENYVNARQDLQMSPSDMLGIDVGV